MHFFQGNLNAANYINDVLEPYAFSYLWGLINPICQQDKIHPHTARVITQFLEEAHVRVLPWPALSRDRNSS